MSQGLGIHTSPHAEIPPAMHGAAVNPSAHPLAHVRYGTERDAMNELFERHHLEPIITHIIESDELQPYHDLALAQQMQITELMAPRLMDLVRDVKRDLSFGDPVDLYVQPESSINAFAIHRLDDESPHAVSLTSATVKSMDDVELRFVLGHELGHLSFDHYRVKIVHHITALRRHHEQRQSSEHSIPQLLERKLERWGRLGEITADRMGFLACGRNMEAAVSSFFKMASGLGPEHLRFDMSAFLTQLESLRRMKRSDVMSTFSHPVTPVRARALQLWAEAGADSADSARLAEVDGEIDEIVSLMEFEAATDEAVQARQFLLSAGVLAAHADGSASAEEQEAVIRLLLQVTGDPEGHLEKIKSLDEARRMLDEACGWLMANTGQERFALFAQVAHIVALDGRLSDSERAFMLEVATKLGIPERAAKEAIHEVLTRYVQSRPASGAGVFGQLRS